MSTRSTVAVKIDAGTYLAIYIHFDGYPEKPGVGYNLLKHFNSYDKARALVELGNLRCIDEDGMPLPYNELYGRGATAEAAVQDMGYGGQQFNYLWEDGRWRLLDRPTWNGGKLTPKTCKASGCDACDGSCMLD